MIDSIKKYCDHHGVFFLGFCDSLGNRGAETHVLIGERENGTGWSTWLKKDDVLAEANELSFNCASL